MSRFRHRPARDDGAREVLDRAVAFMREYQRGGYPVTAAAVLELLGAGPETAPVPATAARDPLADPLADPMTGAKWAGPPGSAPPGNP